MTRAARKPVELSPRTLASLPAVLAALLLAGCVTAPGPGLTAGGVRQATESPPEDHEPRIAEDVAAGVQSGLAAISAGITPTFERRPWSYLETEGSEIVTPHFRLYTTLRSPRWLDDLPEFYERCLRLYTSEFGVLPPPSRPLSAYIFRDNREWKAKTREILPDEADAFMSLGRGGFTTQGVSVLFYIGSRDTFAIAAHEGWHQYTQKTFKHALPIWLEEGLAAYMEAVPRRRSAAMRAWDNDERRSALARAWRRDELIPLRELLTITPQSLLDRGKNRLLTYYAQVWALARFLAEGEGGKHRAGLQELLSDAAHGRMTGRIMGSRGARFHRRWGVQRQIRNGPLALTAYFGRDLQQIADEYDRFVEVVARTRGPLRADDEADW